MAGQSIKIPLENFVVETALRDGTPARLRLVQRDDKHLLKSGMEHMSKESHYFRFFASIAKLPEKALRQFTEIDHVDHEAIGALGIGEAPGDVFRQVSAMLVTNR